MTDSINVYFTSSQNLQSFPKPRKVSIYKTTDCHFVQQRTIRNIFEFGDNRIIQTFITDFSLVREWSLFFASHPVPHGNNILRAGYSSAWVQWYWIHVLVWSDVSHDVSKYWNRYGGFKSFTMYIFKGFSSMCPSLSCRSQYESSIP